MNKKFKQLYFADLHQYGQGIGAGEFHLKFFRKYFRKAQTSNNKFSLFFCKIILILIREFNGLEINPRTKIGPGFFLGHAYNITINPDAVIGEKFSIHKGALIGQENRGIRMGAPIIGNRVWVGINAVVVGRIRIGNDVLIAPNSYVNIDVPDHSIVIGNPCIVKHCENATLGYIL